MLKEKKFKAVPHGKDDRGNTRFIIVDTETGEVLDDAQGYGYKSVGKAYAAWGWKTRDKSLDAEKAEKERRIMDWMKHHEGFMDQLAWFAMKLDHDVDKNYVAEMLKENGYDDLPCTPAELLRLWRNGPKFAKKRRKR